MFPKLDGDLGSVANHFRFDHLVAVDGSTENADFNEQITPLQSSKQFIATSVPDEEDDEPTLSTDFLATQQQTSDGVTSTATKLLEDIINKSAPKQQPQSLCDISKLTLTMRTSNPQMLKQISLHGNESSSSVASLKQSSTMTICDDTQQTPRRHFEYSRFMLVDQRSISDTEDNAPIESGTMKKNYCSKTQSCANIKLSCQAPRSPGAILVKEKFIELPKQIAQRTMSLGNPKEQIEGARTSKSVTSSSECVAKSPRNRPNKPRFTTTKVDESKLGVSVLKNDR